MRHAIQEIYRRIYSHLKPEEDKGKDVLYRLTDPSADNVYRFALLESEKYSFITVLHLQNGRTVNLYRIYENGSITVKDDDVEEDDAEVYLSIKVEDSYEMIIALYQKLFQRSPSVISFKEIDRMVGSMNPFNHDLFRMGQVVNDEWTVMFSSVDKNELVLVNTVNGRRFIIDVGLARTN